MKNKGKTNSPAISELSAHILQVGIAHVINSEDEQVVIFLDRFPDIGVQASGLFLVGLFGGLGLVDDAGALRARHCGGLVGEKFENPVLKLSTPRRSWTRWRGRWVLYTSAEMGRLGGVRKSIIFFFTDNSRNIVDAGLIRLDLNCMGKSAVNASAD